MNTHQATYETGLERIERKMEERETRMLLAMAAMVGLATAVIGLGIAFLAFAQF